MAKERFKLIPAVWIFLKKDNKILLLLRQNTGWEDGKFGLPAGHVDGNETIIQAAVRETKEEAGVEVNKDDLNVVHVLHKRNADGAESIDFFLETTKWEETPKINEPEKCEKIEWFSLDNLPENIVGCLKHVIEQIKKNIFYSEYGWKGEWQK
jgi:8-oxo-dGTP pyrophosphatase MutT (NUDIX family)